MSSSEAIPLFTEELNGCVLLHGMEHKETTDSASHLVELLWDAGQLLDAEALAKKHGVAGSDYGSSGG